MEGSADFLSTQNLITLGIKFGGISMSLVYGLFLIALPKQISQMKKIIDIRDRGWLLFIAYVQLILAVTLFFYSLLLL